MRYLFLIWTDDDVVDALSTDERAAAVAEYEQLGTELEARAGLTVAAQLRPPSTATTVRVRSSEVLVSDGPFAETSEHVGGLYIVECEDLDAALDLASRIPGARLGAVEVWPILEP